MVTNFVYVGGDDGDDKNSTDILIPALVLLGFGGVIFVLGVITFMYRRYQLKKKSRVSFEMANFPSQGSPEPTTKRKALNESVGYGEFVDETLWSNYLLKYDLKQFYSNI